MANKVIITCAVTGADDSVAKNAAVPVTAASKKNGNFGMPGSTASAASRKELTPSALG